jgi:hypothetical protein
LPSFWSCSRGCWSRFPAWGGGAGALADGGEGSAVVSRTPSGRRPGDRARDGVGHAMHDAVADKVHGASERDLTQGRFPEAIAIATALEGKRAADFDALLRTDRPSIRPGGFCPV